MAYPQAVSRGFALVSNQLIAYEQAFLQGYFRQGPIPYPAIRLYEALALLDKWSTTIARSYSSKPVRRFTNKLKNPFFKSGFKSLVAEIAKVELVVVSIVLEITQIIGFTEAAEIMI